MQVYSVSCGATLRDRPVSAIVGGPDLTQESTLARPGGCEVTCEQRPGFETVLTPAALDFVAELTREFGGRVSELLARREARQAQIDAGHRPDFLVETRA